MRKIQSTIMKDGNINILEPTTIKNCTFINCHLAFYDTDKGKNLVTECIFIDKHPQEAYFIGHD